MSKRERRKIGIGQVAKIAWRREREQEWRRRGKVGKENARRERKDLRRKRRTAAWMGKVSVETLEEDRRKHRRQGRKEDVEGNM